MCGREQNTMSHSWKSLARTTTTTITTTRRSFYVFSENVNIEPFSRSRPFDSLPSFSSWPCDEQVADRRQSIVEKKNERLFRMTLIRIEQKLITFLICKHRLCREEDDEENRENIQPAIRARRKSHHDDSSATTENKDR